MGNKRNRKITAAAAIFAIGLPIGGGLFAADARAESSTAAASNSAARENDSVSVLAEHHYNSPAERANDALLITDALNVRYLTGFTGSNSALLVHAGSDEASVFCTDGRYRTQSQRQVPDLRRLIERSCVPRLATLAAEAGIGRLGFESHVVTVDGHAALAKVTAAVVLVATSRPVEALRLIKDDAEVALLRAACSAADTALAELLAAASRDRVTVRTTARAEAMDVAARLRVGQRAAIIAAGIVPGGMEMMDRPAIHAAEDFVHAGYPLDVDALLIVELDGCAPEVDHLMAGSNGTPRWYA